MDLPRDPCEAGERKGHEAGGAHRAPPACDVSLAAHGSRRRSITLTLYSPVLKEIIVKKPLYYHYIICVEFYSPNSEAGGSQ